MSDITPTAANEPSNDPAALDPAALEPGDLVVLRSGGPVLTIANVAGAHAHCIWFSGEDVLQRAEIPLACLDPAEDAGGVLDEISYSEEDFDVDQRDEDEDEGREGKKKKKKKKNDDD